MQTCATWGVLDLGHGYRRGSYHANTPDLEESIVFGGVRRGSKRGDAVAAAAANLEQLGLNLRCMNWGGLNHVTYYEPGKKKKGASEVWNRGVET